MDAASSRIQAMKERIEDTIVKTLFRAEPMSEEQMAEQRRRQQRPPSDPFHLSAPAKTGAPSRLDAPGGAPARPTTVVRKGEKIGRNAPCPCGSGKKYKKCHGAAQKVG